MIPTVQFDPATLAIWTTTGLLPEPAASFAEAAMCAAACGTDPTESLEELSQSDPLRRRILWLASCVWHEKRHFFDTCLTNYGARRFRDLFSLAGSLLPLLAQALHEGEPVWFPVEVYGCRVRRRILGIPEPASNIVEIARIARVIKSFVAQLDTGPGSGGSVIHVGAEAQLEGLAQVSQINSIEHRFGVDELLGVTAEHVHRLPPEGPYRAIEAVSGVLGCSAERAGGVITLNPGLAAALFVTALCGRFYGMGPEPPADFVAPWPRLARLMGELGPKPGRFDMPDEEAWAIVDATARRVWGRSALEEIAADIDASEAKVAAAASWINVEGLGDAFADFITLRRRLLAAVHEAGPASLLPRAFPELWLDRLLPWHVVATPAGDLEKEGAPVVFGVRLNLPSGFDRVFSPNVAWARLRVAPPERAEAGFAPRDRAAWSQMLARHGPRALLMLNGRRHRRMVQPEVDHQVAEIEEMGIPVRFAPYWEWPEQRDGASRAAEAVELANFSGRSHFTCDITGENIEPTQAAVLTPWELRRSPLLQRFRDSAGDVAEVMLARDWSDWVVRRDLLD